jgi:hypothetical protein
MLNSFAEADQDRGVTVLDFQNGARISRLPGNHD